MAMNISRLLSWSRVVAVGTIALILAACGDSGSTDTPKGPDMSVATMEDLPNCTENREGVTALVAEDNSTYECKSGKWTFVSAPMQTVETLDDLSNCTSKAEGDTVMVASESAIFRCDDGKWEKYRTLTDTLASAEDLLACVAKREGNTSYITKEHALYRCEDGSWEKMVAFMDTVKTKDDLPNCTGKKEGDSTFVSKDESVYLCIDKEWAYLGEVTGNTDDLPNCTEKREGNKAFVAAERETLICSDGKWLPYDIYKEMEEMDSPESSSGSVKSSNSQKEESSSSISNKSSSSQKIESSSSKDSMPNGEKYDCSVYKCVTTEYLNQEMLAAGKYGELLDVRDSQVYRTIQIGEQIWMAQNLNYASVNGNADHGKASLCYDDSVEKCDKYGRIYNWTASANVPSSYSTSSFVSEERNKEKYQGICPEGFHIPQTSEVETLLAYAGVISPAGLWVLSSDSLWKNSKAENVFGLSILPSGWLTDYKSYVAEGRGVRFWLALDEEHTAAYVWGMSDDDLMKGLDFAINYQHYSFYVRCIKD